MLRGAGIGAAGLAGMALTGRVEGSGEGAAGDTAGAVRSLAVEGHDLHAAAVRLLLGGDEGATTYAHDHGGGTWNLLGQREYWLSGDDELLARDVALLAHSVVSMAYVAGDPQVEDESCGATVAEHVVCGHRPIEHHDGHCAGCIVNLGFDAPHNFEVDPDFQHRDLRKSALRGEDGRWHHWDACASPVVDWHDHFLHPSAQGYTRCFECTGWYGSKTWSGTPGRLRDAALCGAR